MVGVLSQEGGDDIGDKDVLLWLEPQGGAVNNLVLSKSIENVERNAQASIDDKQELSTILELSSIHDNGRFTQL